MTANRLTPTGTTPTTGADFMDDIRAEIVALWLLVADRLTDVAGTNAITAKAGTTILAYSEGMSFVFVPVAGNTDAVTIDVDEVGPIDALDRDGQPLEEGAFVADRAYLLRVIGGALRVLSGMSAADSSASIGLIPIGGTIAYYGATPPSDAWLFPDGSTIGRVGSGATHENDNYETLFNLLKAVTALGNAGTEDFANGDTVYLPAIVPYRLIRAY